MTTIADVTRQIEAALRDPRYPPTLAECRMYIAILLKACAHRMDARVNS